MEDLYKINIPTTADNFEAFLFFLLAFVIYFFPGIVAWRRKHRNENPIVVLNLCFGWTLIGWLAALMWSLTANVKNAGNKVCLYCAESIKENAKICRFCGRKQVKDDISTVH
jgi:hypothetical protein